MKLNNKILDLLHGRKYLRKKETTAECIEILKEGGKE